MSAPNIDPALHQARKPEWIKVRLPNNPRFFSTKALIDDLRLNTVCESAQCPNRWECWSGGTATFMIAGDRCTRACGFCAVTTAKPFALEADEPQRVAEAVRRMKLRHIVITAVARDDLRDGGAEHFARTIEAIRAVSDEMKQEARKPGKAAEPQGEAGALRGSEPEADGGGSKAVPASSEIVIEVLTPDFHAKEDCLRIVAAARPHIFNHNLETVERLTPLVRSRAKYPVSLKVLRRMKEIAPEIVTKSGIMLGLGETEPEIFQTMDDLREAQVQVLTIGQYLRPSPQHLPVVEYIHPDTFKLYERIAYEKGFEFVASGPLVRSSYHAADYDPRARHKLA
jgi:lipoic acid synthetase